jgi:hypothetical protein
MARNDVRVGKCDRILVVGSPWNAGLWARKARGSYVCCKKDSLKAADAMKLFIQVNVMKTDFATVTATASGV